MKYRYNFNRVLIRQHLILLILSISLMNICNAQEQTSYKSNSSFIEWNVGVAKIGQGNLDDGLLDGSFFPGTSLLYGSTYVNENNTIFEYEIGAAFPSIITGKLGIGKKIGDTKLIIGVRPFPFNLFYQASLPSGKRGYFILSVEFNPIDQEQFISMGSKGLFTLGYRWNVGKRKS